MRVHTFCRRDLKYLLFAMSVERISQVYLRRYYSEFKEIKMSFVCDWIMIATRFIKLYYQEIQEIIRKFVNHILLCLTEILITTKKSIVTKLPTMQYYKLK